MRTSLSVIILSVLFVTFSSVCGASILEAERAKMPTGAQRLTTLDRVICVDGLKLFQTIGPAWGEGAAPVVSTIQLYEERGGKVVPAKCSK